MTTEPTSPSAPTVAPMDAADRPAGRALSRDPAPDAPSPPIVQRWNRRIVGWGLAPLLISGMLVGVIPGGAQTMSLVGALLVVAVTVPVTVYTMSLRRRNQRAYDVAVDAARSGGKIVRVIETDDGRFDYVLADAPVVERMTSYEMEGRVEGQSR